MCQIRLETCNLSVAIKYCSKIITLALGKGISPVLKQKMTTNLRASADTTVVAAERNTLLMLDDILQESDSPPQRHTLDGVGGFSRILCKK